MQGRLRIIAGKWRRQQIYFDSKLNIRPTTNAARETLFNWLQGTVENTMCLDLFAGSGALGFEALSRGANSVVFVDSNRRCIRHLKQNAERFSPELVSIVHQSAQKFIKETESKFDLVFIDPPYFKKLSQSAIDSLVAYNRLNPGAHIYVEVERVAVIKNLSAEWEILRQYSAGSRAYHLLKFKSGSQSDSVGS